MLTYILFNLSDTDLKTFQIPDRYPVAICLMAIGSAFLGFTQLSLARANLALAILLITSPFTGLGDSKLLASLTLLLGKEIIPVIIFSFCLAGLYSCARLILRSITLKDSIAFGPFISVSALAIWFTNLSELT